MTTYGTFDDVPLARGADIELASIDQQVWAQAEKHHKTELLAAGANVALFARIIRHYVLEALRLAGAQIDGDTYAELDAAFKALNDAIQRVGRLQ